MFPYVLISSLLLNIYSISQSTQYPLYAIISDSQTLSSQDLYVIATNFTSAQFSPNSSSAKEIHSYNPDFKIVHYHNTWSTSDIQRVESDKSSIAKYPFGNLTKSLSSNYNDNNITLTLIKTNHSSEIIPIIPSTLNKTTDKYSKSCKEFISFIQIDNEYMKVLSVNKLPENDTLNNTIYSLIVERAFIGSTLSNYSSSSHNQGSIIFSPVYTHSAPGISTCSQLKYAVGIESEYAIQSLLNATINDVVKNGADGSWYDCFFQYSFKSVNQLGMPLNVNQIWSFDRNTFYNCTSYRISQQNRLTAIWDGLHKNSNTKNKNITIFANDMEARGYNDDQCGLKEMLIANSTMNYNKPLDGFCIEHYAIVEYGNCSYKYVTNLNVQDWKNNVNELIDAAKNGLKAMPMIGDAGCKSPAFEELDDKEYNKYENFGYATYLLGVYDRFGNVPFGIPALRKINGSKIALVNERFFWEIGQPVQFEDNVDLYKVNGSEHFAFQRIFENGIIIVNPYNKSDDGIALNKKYYNPETNSFIQGSVNVDAFTAYILLDSTSK